MSESLLTKEQKLVVKNILETRELRDGDPNVRIGMAFATAFPDSYSLAYTPKSIVNTTKILMEIAIMDAAINESVYDADGWRERFEAAVRYRDYGRCQESQVMTPPSDTTTPTVPKKKPSWFWWVVIPTATVGAALTGIGVYMAVKDR